MSTYAGGECSAARSAPRWAGTGSALVHRREAPPRTYPPRVFEVHAAGPRTIFTGGPRTIFTGRAENDLHRPGRERLSALLLVHDIHRNAARVQPVEIRAQ